jgi:glycosyltransferase involved in cell wall biosynthesis
VVRPSADPEVVLHLVPVHGRGHPNLFWFDRSALRAVLRRLRPAIVDLHEEPFGLAVAAALPLIKRYAPDARVCIYSSQNLPKRYPPPFSLMERRALSAAGAAYPCSTEAGERLRARGFRGRMHVVPLGVTVPRVVCRPSSPVRVGFVGRLEPYKGGLIALRAFARAALGTTASLVIIGTGSEQDAMREAARAEGIESAVEFTGLLSQDATLERMNELDVVLVPSLTTPRWKEQFGRVAAQAMVAEAVVIASDSAALREVVGDAGLLVTEGDVNGFARVLRLLIDDPEHRAEIGAAARARAVERFSWEAVAAQMDQMYRDLLSA